MTRIIASCLLLVVGIAACGDGGSDDSADAAIEAADETDDTAAEIDDAAEDVAAAAEDADAGAAEDADADGDGDGDDADADGDDADADADGDDADADGDDADAASGGDASVSVIWNGEALPLTRHSCFSMSQFTGITAISDDEGVEFTVRTDGGFMESVELHVGDEEYYERANIPSDRDAEPNPSALDVIDFEGGSHAVGTLILPPYSDLAYETLPEGATVDFDIRC